MKTGIKLVLLGGGILLREKCMVNGSLEEVGEGSQLNVGN